MVAGGDGFSGRRNARIDPTNGRATDHAAESTEAKGLPSATGSTIVTRHCRLSTAFSFPTAARSGADRFGRPCVRRISRIRESDGHYVWTAAASAGIAPTPTKFGGIDYASPGHGVLFMHANKGVTFDLEPSGGRTRL